MASRRTGFCLDAKSMGLNRSRPASPSSLPKCEPKQEQESQSVDCACPSTSRQVVAREEGASACPRKDQCKFNTEALPTDYYRSLIKKLKDDNGDGGQVNSTLNNIFLSRLDEIDCLDDQTGDDMFSSQLRLVTFQEWVDLLLNLNSVLLGNMTALEEEAYSKIVAYFNTGQGKNQQAVEENRKLRNDLCSIIKFVQGGYHRQCWDLEGLSLETVSKNQLLGLTVDQRVPESESEKMAECMKSLVNEIAAKHDEICHLKSQLGTLDEVVLTARQKLLLKDQCIAQLNQQLQDISQLLDDMPEQTPSEVSCIEDAKDVERDSDQRKVDEATSSASMTACMLQNLSIQDCHETEVLRILDIELMELLRVHNIQEHKTTETWRRRIAYLYNKLRSERDDTINKLENIRNWLSLLQSDLDQSGLTLSQPPIEVDESDSKMLECLRGRLRSLNQSNLELQRKYQLLHADSEINIADSQAKCEVEKCLNQRNSLILREIADLLCKLGSTEFSYNEIYNESSTENPFCAAIMEIFDQKSQEEELARQKACKCDTKTPIPTKESTRARPAAMAKTKSTTRPTTKPTTRPATKPTTTTKPRSTK